jgi:hypothetical protein
MDLRFGFKSPPFFMLSFLQHTMTDTEKLTSDDSSPHRQPMERETEPALESRISSPERRDPRDRSPSRRSKRDHPYRNRKRGFQSSTYRPNYDQPAERARYDGRAEPRYDARDEWRGHDEIEFRYRKYDSWRPPASRFADRIR